MGGGLKTTSLGVLYNKKFIDRYMSHITNYNSIMDIIETKVQGEIFLKEIKEIISDTIHIAIEKNCSLFLVDYSEASIKLSTIQVYDLPKIISDIALTLKYNANKVKRAIIISHKDAEKFKFGETVSINRGQKAKVFSNIDEAKKWLTNI